MLSAIILVGLQLVDIVDDCNYHNCIMGPFSFVPCPEGPKTGYLPPGPKTGYLPPMHKALQKKSEDYTTMIMENLCIILAIMPIYWLVATPLL